MTSLTSGKLAPTLAPSPIPVSAGVSWNQLESAGVSWCQLRVQIVHKVFPPHIDNALIPSLPTSLPPSWCQLVSAGVSWCQPVSKRVQIVHKVFSPHKDNSLTFSHLHPSISQCQLVSAKGANYAHSVSFTVGELPLSCSPSPS